MITTQTTHILLSSAPVPFSFLNPVKTTLHIVLAPSSGRIKNSDSDLDQQCA